MEVIHKAKEQFIDELEEKRWLIEEQKREAKSLHRTLIELSPDAIYTFSMTGVVLSCNDAATSIMGYSKEELIGKHFSKIGIFKPVDFPRYFKLLNSVRQGKVVEPQEVVFRHKDGTFRVSDVRIRPINISGERFILVTLRDITERKKTEQEREKLLRELEDKTKELEQIIYVTSHDLRSPLVNIQGFTRELEQPLKEVQSIMQTGDITPAVSEKLSAPMNEDIPDALKYILASTSKIDSLLSGLLRLSRLGRAALAIKKLDMNELITDVIRAFEFKIKAAGVTLEVEHLPSCRGDQTQINQIFSNLIDNALKFLDPNKPGTIRVSGRKKGSQVTYCVEDNGIGIAPDHQERIFEIFQRLDPSSSSGEGLGLTIVRRILDRHSGKIWIKSERDKGSKFFISLPAVQDI